MFFARCGSMATVAAKEAADVAVSSWALLLGKQDG
jgi:hypothetical protein